MPLPAPRSLGLDAVFRVKRYRGFESLSLRVCDVASLPSRLGASRLRQQHVPHPVTRAQPGFVDVDVLDLTVLVVAELAMLPPEPRLLVAAKWVSRIDRVVVVDPHGTRRELLRHFHRTLHVARPHRAGKPIHEVVGHPHRGRIVVER